MKIVNKARFITSMAIILLFVVEILATLDLIATNDF